MADKKLDTLTTLTIAVACLGFGFLAGLGVAATLSPALTEVTSERDMLAIDLAEAKRKITEAQRTNQEQRASHRDELELRDTEMEVLAFMTERARATLLLEKMGLFVVTGDRADWVRVDDERRGAGAAFFLIRQCPGVMDDPAEYQTAVRRLAKDVNDFYMVTTGGETIVEAMAAIVSARDQWEWFRVMITEAKEADESA